MKKNKPSVCGATILKLQVDVNFGTFEHFVCLIVTINFNCNNKTLFVECIVRCKQLSIKLLDEESRASSSVSIHDEDQLKETVKKLKIIQLCWI